MTSAAESVRAGRSSIRSWPLLILALPASAAVWSGWVGIGRMTGFGEVHPLPGIWDSFHIDTAVTLPVGVEAYAAYALRAWLTTSTAVSARTRRFAAWSAVGSLLLGMAGQVAYHLLTEAGARHAPWEVTMAVSCLPVLVLAMGAALAHLLRADVQGSSPDLQSRACDVRPSMVGARTGDQGNAEPAGVVRAGRLAEVRRVVARLAEDGLPVSRRNLRSAGMHGSNAELGVLSHISRSMQVDLAVASVPDGVSSLR